VTKNLASVVKNSIDRIIKLLPIGFELEVHNDSIAIEFVEAMENYSEIFIRDHLNVNKKLLENEVTLR
jgi:hypothetical protein